MASDRSGFIQLERTFHELTVSEEAGDDADVSRSLGLRNTLAWKDLLSEHRVVLLSEAGSGKTEEIRNVARSLRQKGRAAFFLRIEHVMDSFEEAFEEGTIQEFEEWMASGEEGWLLLDSVDEARLRDPKDFERAIKKIGKRVRPALQRLHVILTGRTSAWRPRTDLLLFRSEIPYEAQKAVVQDSASQVETSDAVNEKSGASFKIVALDDLGLPQVEAFLKGRGVADPKPFRDAVERKDAWSLTTRPLDLAELIDYWKEHGKIGSRLELMQNSVKRRLEERDQDREEARPISPDRLRSGARLVAAVATLGQESAIRVPDGSENQQGLAILDVLPGWTPMECQALLSRPIFDEGIYGTVRFHHRSVREYLMAEWLNALLKGGAPRSRVESLFFRTQYGIEVIVPTMRPVLPWLAVLDEHILAKVMRLAPEVIFEGGDPSHLLLETRVSILRQACEQLAQPAHGRSLTDFAAVQRFANVDLAEEIQALLSKYRDDSDVSWFLLRMIWQGEILAALPEAKQFALKSTDHYARLVALKVVAALGSPSDQREVRRALVDGTDEIRRDWLAEMVRGLPAEPDSVSWLIEALRRTAARKRYDTMDQLGAAVSELVAEWPIDLLIQLVNGFEILLKTPPVVERGLYGISKRYSWLLQYSAEAVARLIKVRNSSAKSATSLFVLRAVPLANAFGEDPSELSVIDSTKIQEWKELNRALFWYDVSESRAALDSKKGERLTDIWRLGIFGALWKFGQDDFDSACEDIKSMPFMDDRLVALSLAFAIYRECGSPSLWKKNLSEAVSGSAELSIALESLLHPNPSAGRKMRQEQARWKRQAARRLAKDEENKRKAKEYLQSHTEALRDPSVAGVALGEVTNSQHYLHQRMRQDSDNRGKWSEGNWQSLTSEFGYEVATAFRDGVMRFWRHYQPVLQSGGAEENSTPFKVVFGLTGLAVEARETIDWALKLAPNEADLATRYAILELNGFPSWLSSVYAAYPDVVFKVISSEIEFELSQDRIRNYVLYDASWSGQWMWDRLAPFIVEKLKSPPRHIEQLRQMLNILQGSSLADAVIAEVASKNARESTDQAMAAMWFSAWVGVAPEIAIPALSARFAELKTKAEQTTFAMNFITELIGARRGGGSARQSYRTVRHMKELYLLMHTYVHEAEDIDRAGTGVYSPGLRDNAQDARDALFSFIKEAPGKEAFLALMDIALEHPSEPSRPWMAFHAREKATRDADIAPWNAHQVREFSESLERTPSNHRDLWALAVDRLLQLKSDLEDGDASIAGILKSIDQETAIRNYIGSWCRDRSASRYAIPQEEELADAKRPDLRFHGVGFDGPVPVELKLADKWTGPHLFERLEAQLCGDYLRDSRSSRGVFALVYHGRKGGWALPGGGYADDFQSLVNALKEHWANLATRYANVEDIEVIGIDLTKRGARLKKDKTKKTTSPQAKKAPAKNTTAGKARLKGENTKKATSPGKIKKTSVKKATPRPARLKGEETRKGASPGKVKKGPAKKATSRKATSRNGILTAPTTTQKSGTGARKRPKQTDRPAGTRNTGRAGSVVKPGAKGAAKKTAKRSSRKTAAKGAITKKIRKR